MLWGYGGQLKRDIYRDRDENKTQNNHLAKISANLERSVLPLSNGVLFLLGTI